MTTTPVDDYDFHSDEDSVRVFTAGPDGVLGNGVEVYVSASRYGDVVLWHSRSPGTGSRSTSPPAWTASS